MQCTFEKEELKLLTAALNAYLVRNEEAVVRMLDSHHDPLLTHSDSSAFLNLLVDKTKWFNDHLQMVQPLREKILTLLQKEDK